MTNEENENLHSWVNVDQAVRPLPPRSLNVGLTLKLYSLCIIVESIWMSWFVFRIFCVVSLKRLALVGIVEM